MTGSCLGLQLGTFTEICVSFFSDHISVVWTAVNDVLPFLVSGGDCALLN